MDYRLAWNSETRSFIAPILSARVEELVLESRWNAQKLAALLRAEFGNWLSAHVAYSGLHGLEESTFDAATEEQRARASAAIFRWLCQERDQVDTQLGRWLPSVAAALQNGKGFRDVAAEIVQAEIAENGPDDRWFAAVVNTLDLCFQALEGSITEEEIENIAERAFSSWIEPEKDAVQQFADELAALSMRAQFRAQYGG